MNSTPRAHLSASQLPEGPSRFTPSLGGVSPLSLLDTEAGVDLVMDTLARIEYGIAA